MSADAARQPAGKRRGRDETLARDLRVWQAVAFLAIFVAVFCLAALYCASKRGPGWEIVIDGQTVCLVRNSDVAERVRKRLINEATRGQDVKGAIKERWVVRRARLVDERKAIELASKSLRRVPPEKRQNVVIRPAVLLSEDQAYQRLKPIVHVLIDAYAIMVDGNPVVYLPSEAQAREVLERVKEKFAEAGPGLLVGKARFREQVKVVQKAVESSRLTTDTAAAVAALTSGGKKYYTVQKGDYPSRIAKKFGLSLKRLYQLNPGIKGKDLHVGQKLVVSTSKPRVTVITVREITEHQPIAPPVERIETYSLPRGKQKVASPGEPGEKKVTLRATYWNDRRVKSQVISSEVIKPAKPKKVLVGIAPVQGTAGPTPRQQGNSR